MADFDSNNSNETKKSNSQEPNAKQSSFNLQLNLQDAETSIRSHRKLSSSGGKTSLRLSFSAYLLFLLSALVAPQLFGGSASQQQLRSIASELSCKLVFESKEPGEPADAYLARLKHDSAAMVDVMITNAATGKEVPVRMTRKMEEFRKLYLPYLKNPVYREPMILSFESQLRMRSDLLRRNLLESSEATKFDVVIVGAGVHGIISAQALIATDPNLKILIVEEGDTAGATFRNAKDTFNINSSNRASGEGTKPLPGEGNINELPNLPIQVSDLTGVKYPTSNDLGSPLVAGLYALVRQNPGVQVLFNTSAQTIGDAGDPKFREQLTVNTQGSEITINSQAILISTGLGTPKYPEKLAETLQRQPELVRFKRGRGKPLPKVVAFEDLVRIIAQSNDPMALFKDKNIGIVGTGDSANVLIEFLIGYASQKAYGQSSAQSGIPNRIGWIGQTRESCEAFIADARSRYAQIGTGLRSSSKDVAAILKGIPGRLENVVVDASLGGRKDSEPINAVGEGGADLGNFDLIVLTTGFEPNVRDLVRNITVQTSGVFRTDADFFNESPTIQTIEGTTATSGRTKTKIGRKIRNREVYVIGTAAGQLASQAELVGIIQNFVSIFNNAPRVVAQSSRVASEVKPLAPAISLAPIQLQLSSRAGKIEVRGLEGTRVTPNQSLNALEAILREAASNLRAGSEGKATIELRIQQAGDKDSRLIVTGETGVYDVKPIVDLLASSREFFNLATEILESLSGKDFLLRIGFKDGRGSPGETSLSLVPTEDRSSLSTIAKVVNQSTALRGIQVIEKVAESPRAALSRVEFSQLNTRIQSIQYNRQTNQLLIEKFQQVFVVDADSMRDLLTISPINSFLTVLRQEGRQAIPLLQSQGNVLVGNSVGVPALNIKTLFGVDFVNFAVPRDAGDRVLLYATNSQGTGTKVILGTLRSNGEFGAKQVFSGSPDDISLAWIGNGSQFAVAQGKRVYIARESSPDNFRTFDLPSKIFQVEDIGNNQIAVRLIASSNQPDVAIIDLNTGSTKLISIGNRIGSNVTMVGDPIRGRVAFLPEERVQKLRVIPIYDSKTGQVTEVPVGENFVSFVESGFFSKAGDLFVYDGATNALFKAKID